VNPNYSTGGLYSVGKKNAVGSGHMMTLRTAVVRRLARFLM
jgi:hypothetical protein